MHELKEKGMEDVIKAESNIFNADDSSDEDEIGAFNSRQPSLPHSTKKKFPISCLPDIFFGKNSQKLAEPQNVISLLENFHYDSQNYYGYSSSSKQEWYQDKEWGWYFIFHQLGIDLLYHSEVETKYKEMKIKMIGKSYFNSPFIRGDQIDNLIPEGLTKRTIALMLIGKENWLPKNDLQNLSNQVRNDFQINKISLFRHQLEKVGVRFAFSSENFVEYLSNIRLSNRSIKRLIQDKCDITVDREWKLMPNSEISSESVTISHDKEGNYSRSDLLTDFGAYISTRKDSVKSKISKLINVFGLSDDNIATLVRLTLRHDSITVDYLGGEIAKIITNLTHLLFGIEGARSPEVFITHQMILDLIMAAGWKWDNVLQNFSASFGKEILPIMRKANNDLHPYLSCPYYYPGPMLDKVQEKKVHEMYDSMLKKYIYTQANVFHEWRKAFYPDINDGNDLLKKVQDRYMEWFKIECPNQNKIDNTKNNYGTTSNNVTSSETIVLTTSTTTTTTTSSINRF